MTAGSAGTTVLPWERQRREGVAESHLAELANGILLRCRGEGPANCVARCPLHVDARGYVQLTRAGRYRDALQLVRDKLPFPGILGYACAHPCELHCKRIDMDRAVRIRDIKRFLAEWEPGEPQHVLDHEPPRPERVAVIGAGPSGLIAAHDLARNGYRVTLLERETEIGGCLVHKIPEWRLPRRVVERDLSIIAALEIDVRSGVRVGTDIAFEDLRSEYDAVLLLCGYEGGLDLLRRDGTGLRRTIRGTVRADPVTCETGLPAVFAGGDAVSGPGSVIDALALGRRCAESASRHLEGRDLREGRENTLPRRLLWTLEIDEAERRRRERAPVLLQPFGPALEVAEASAESERCLDCECRLCVKDCEFLTQHCRSPKDLARRVRDDLEADETLRMVYSCNVCSLCATVCPEDLGTGAMLMEARREAVRRGRGPLAEHKSTIVDYHLSLSGTFGLLMSEPGRSRSKRLFFPGCALPAVAPTHTLAIYNELRRHFRGTGVLMGCCGAPAEVLGLEEEFGRARESILRALDSVGAEELITVCPDCTHTLKRRVPGLKLTTAWELLAEQWQPPRLREGVVVSVHDSCVARSEPGIRAAVRRLLEAGGCTVEETEYGGEKTRCCGLGGMIRPVDANLSRRIASRRAAESSRPWVTYCAGCRNALADSGGEALHLFDFLLAHDWQKALRSGSPGRFRRYVRRLRTKRAFKKLRPVGAE
jgi:NADPH-dependent glutamate synthase beta subunit-like oxidoreductase